MKQIIGLLAFLCFPFSLICQVNEFCGTVESADPNFSLKQFRAFQKSEVGISNRTKQNVSIQLHVVTRSGGSGGVSLEDVSNSIIELNREFDTSGISFTPCGEINFVNDTYLFENYNHRGSDLDIVADIAVSYPNKVNIFYFQDLLVNGYAYINFGPSFEGEHIAVASNGLSHGSTLSHEMGHYFGLYHTHSTSNGIELVNRNTCEKTGDLCCDTPADNNEWEDGKTTAVTRPDGRLDCEHVSNTVDINGDYYMPDPNNLMSYSRFTRIFADSKKVTCRNDFSPDQEARMRFYLYEYRKHLSVDCGEELVNLENLAVENKINIFPNPTTSQVKFQIPYQQNLSRVEVYDAAGNVFTSKGDFENNIIDLSTCSNGIYFFSFVFENQRSEVFKILKE